VQAPLAVCVPTSSVSVTFEPSLPAERGAKPQTSSVRRWAIEIAKLLVSVALLVYLLRGVDLQRLWTAVRQASWLWLTAALALYFLMLAVSTWRWSLLLQAQGVVVRSSRLLGSFLVATFFNNFLPSNIGGDVIRIRDTAPAARSRTLAATIVAVDRVLGLLALVLIAALGATLTRQVLHSAAGPLSPWLLWIGFTLGSGVMLQAFITPQSLLWWCRPLRLLHAEWVDARLARITQTLERFRTSPVALAGGALGAIAVQAILVAFYVAIAYSMHIPVSPWHLAVIVPVSFVVQMLPISMNGIGVREYVFASYFALLGLPREAALLISFVGAALIMLWSLAGAAVYMARRA
jgi:glycosyltransferase 2 family protein